MKLKERHTSTFFSPTEDRCLPSPSKIKPEEREFVVDSGASMHMISRKDLNSAELETVTTSRSPTTVTTANGEMQTNEAATVYVKDVGIFLPVKLLQDTAAVLSLGKFCEDHGYSYVWTSGQKKLISLKMVYGSNATRRTTCQSWSLGYQQLLSHCARLLLLFRHHQRRTVKIQPHVQLQLNVRVRTGKHGETHCINQAKSQNPIKCGP